MKIALISHHYPTKLSPHSGKFVKDHFDLLKKSNDFDVSLYVPTPFVPPLTERWQKNTSPLLLSSVSQERVWYLSFPGRKMPHLIKKSLAKNLLSHLNKKQFDFIHVHWLNPDGMIIPFLKKLGYRTAITIHGSDWYLCFNNPALKPHILETLTTVDKVFYSGPKLKRDIENLYPFVSKKSQVIYNMVDSAEYFSIDNSQTKRIREELGWSSAKNHVLTVASLRPEKGVDILVSSISEVAELKDFQFHIIGLQENTPYARKVLSDANKNSHKNISFHKPVSPDKLVKYYQASDFYVLPSRREGFNVSILEAISCGLPIVGTNVGGNKEVINLGTGRLTLDHKNLKSDIIQMSKCFKDYDKRKLHDIINTHFGKEAFLKRLKETYFL